MSNKIINTGELVQILQMFDDMSKDLRIGRLTNSEKDILLKMSSLASQKILLRYHLLCMNKLYWNQ